MKLETPVMPANDSVKLDNAIKIFLNKLKQYVMSYHVFYEIFMNIQMIANINSIIMNRKTIQISI